MKDATATAKERPILLRDEMIRPLLAGLKTQHRQEVKLPNGRVSKKPQPIPDYIGRWINSVGSDLWAGFGSGEIRPDGVQNTVNTMRTGWFACPFGKVGDRLWVREKYFPMRYDWKELPNSPILYSDGFIRERETWQEDYQGLVPPMGHAWKGAVTMPRQASRLLLEIVRVRVERLQDITEPEAYAEGIESQFYSTPKDHNHGPLDFPGFTSYKLPYEKMWGRINGLESWAANPWVWAIEFKLAGVARP